jgi:hypothetical protein
MFAHLHVYENKSRGRNPSKVKKCPQLAENSRFQKSVGAQPISSSFVMNDNQAGAGT